MLLDVPSPGVERARDPLLRGLVSDEMLAPHAQQLIARALQQPLVQVELGGEVVVHDRRRDARAARDLIHGGAVVAALREHREGGALDHLAPLLRAQPLSPSRR
jgi:hypothetical protein